MTYRILLEPHALHDIQSAIDYYDEKKIGLGKNFESALNKHLIILEKNPFFQVRYDEVHCLPIKKFPFMIHYTIHKEVQKVIIRAILHTSLSSEKWKRK